MEFKNHEKKLQNLRGKALELHERMKEKMKEQQSFSFCSHCSSHGRYCVVADCSPEERERMISITDSLKDLHNLILSLLQGVKWKHKRQRDEAIARIEERRKAVRESVERLSKKEKESSSVCGVVEEVIEFVGDGKNGDGFWWNLDDERNVNVNGRFYSFVVGTTRFGFEFLVIFATIYYASLKFGKNGKQQQKKKHKHGVMIEARIKKARFLPSDDGEVVHLDVLCGRG